VEGIKKRVQRERLTIFELEDDPFLPPESREGEE
jgi:hypothetical protein